MPDAEAKIYPVSKGVGGGGEDPGAPRPGEFPKSRLPPPVSAARVSDASSFQAQAQTGPQEVSVLPDPCRLRAPTVTLGPATPMVEPRGTLPKADCAGRHHGCSLMWAA